MESTKSLEKWMEGFAKAAEQAGVAPEQVSALVKEANRVSLQQKFPAKFAEGFNKVAATIPAAAVAKATSLLPIGTLARWGLKGGIGLGMLGVGGHVASKLFGVEGAMPLGPVMDMQDAFESQRQRAIRARKAYAYNRMTPEQQDAFQLRELQRNKILGDSRRAIMGISGYGQPYVPQSWANPYHY